MKVYIYFILLLFSFQDLNGQSKAAASIDYPGFLKSKGLEILAEAAHPQKYKSGFFLKEKSSCTISHNQILFDLWYYEPNTPNDPGNTKVTFNQEKCILKSMSFKTNYFMSVPFASFYTLFILTYQNEGQLIQDKVLSNVMDYYKDEFGRSINEFTPQELIVATLAWQWGKELSKINNIPNSSSLPSTNVVKVIDGINISGTPQFIRRVEESLDVIKTYDPYLYREFFANRAGKYTLVKTILFDPDPKKSVSTITVDGGIKLNFTYSRYHYGSLFDADKYKLASTLVHEMTHLYQNYQYTRLYTLSDYGYYQVYSYDPILRAQNEIEACEASNHFLEKVISKAVLNKSISGRIIEKSAKMAVVANNKYAASHNSLWEAGRYLFMSNFPNSECGQSCRTLFESKLDEFGAQGPSFKNLASYYRQMYP